LTPKSGDGCALAGLTCSYGCNVTAKCTGGAWTVLQSNISCPADGGGTHLPDGAIGCGADNDCRAGLDKSPLVCSPGGAGSECGACVPPTIPCNADTDCVAVDGGAPPKPMVCDQTGPCACATSCIPACQSAADCGPNLACSSGHCVAKHCTSAADCSATSTVDYACNAGTCGPKTCSSDVDCGGHYCVNKICYPIPGVCVEPPA
jgi:hypothetical protein